MKGFDVSRKARSSPGEIPCSPIFAPADEKLRSDHKARRRRFDIKHSPQAYRQWRQLQPQRQP